MTQSTIRFLQVYTGNGKGKTTAAIGQVIRASGYGLRTYFLMLMKDFPYNEVQLLRSLTNLVTVVQCGGDDFVFKRQLPGEVEVAAARQALQDAKVAMLSGSYDIIVLDEIFPSIYFQLVPLNDLEEFIRARPETVELVLTGRYCPQSVIAQADLVTEMKEVKHYYTTKGVTSRKGFES